MEQTGHLACLLPFPEPKAVINRIQEQHPQLKISYRQISLRVDWKKADELPDGKCNHPRETFAEKRIIRFLARCHRALYFLTIPAEPEVGPKFEYVGCYL